MDQDTTRVLLEAIRSSQSQMESRLTGETRRLEAVLVDQSRTIQMLVHRMGEIESSFSRHPSGGSTSASQNVPSPTAAAAPQRSGEAKLNSSETQKSEESATNLNSLFGVINTSTHSFEQSVNRGHSSSSNSSQHPAPQAPVDPYGAIPNGSMAGNWRSPTGWSGASMSTPYDMTGAVLPGAAQSISYSVQGPICRPRKRYANKTSLSSETARAMSLDPPPRTPSVDPQQQQQSSPGEVKLLSTLNPNPLSTEAASNENSSIGESMENSDRRADAVAPMDTSSRISDINTTTGSSAEVIDATAGATPNASKSPVSLTLERKGTQALPKRNDPQQHQTSINGPDSLASSEMSSSISANNFRRMASSTMLIGAQPVDNSMSFEVETDAKKTSKASGGHKGKVSKSIDPESPLVGIFDFLYIITTTVTMVSLVTIYHPLSGVDVNETPTAWLIVWLLVLYAYSGAFMAMRLRIRCRRDKSSWVLEDDVREIKKLYLRRWFGLDLFLSVPFEFLLMGWFNAGFHYALAKHFLRYFRTLTLANSANPLSPSRTWFRFAIFCATMILIAHVAASGFWSVMESSNKGIDYVASLYWSVATMTSVGYGDISPENSDQRIYATFCMLCGILVISTFTAFATSYLTSKDAITEETDKHKMMMTALLQHYRVPWSLSREVIAVFPSVLHNNLLTHFRSSIDSLPPFLRDQLMRYLNAAQLRSIKMFHTIPDQVLLELASNMHTVFVPAFEYVIRESEQSDALYIVLRGVMEVTKMIEGVETVLGTLRDGEYFGEVGLVEDELRNANVMAAVASELLLLSKSSFEDLMAHSKEFMKSVIEHVRERNAITARAKSSATLKASATSATSEDGQEEYDD